MKKLLIVISIPFIFGVGFFIYHSNLYGLLAQLGTSTEKPFAPYGLATSITNYNQINLSWTNNSINISNSIAVNNYKVFRRQSYATSWDIIANPTTTNYVDLNVGVGSYDYKVSSCNDIGCSADSEFITVIIAADTIAPSKPENFTIPLKEVGAVDAKLYWDSSSDDIGIKTYNIYRSIATSNNFNFIASTSSTTYTDTNLSPVTNYYYQIKAVDFAKNESVASDIKSIVTPTLATADNFIRIVSPNGGECFTLPDNLRVTWTGSNTNNVALYYANELIFKGKDTIIDWYMTASVSPTTNGFVKVVAVDNNGVEGLADTNDNPFTISLDCSKVNQNTVSIPAIPTFFRASLIAGTANINLIWQDNSSNESGFNVYKRTIPDGKWQLLAKLGANTTSYIDADVLAGDYEYDVNACNITGCSIYSIPSQITALSSLPTKTYTTAELIPGNMITAVNSDDPDVYIINAYGLKRLFLNPIIFDFYGHLGGYANIKNVSTATTNSYKTSGLFQNCETNDEKVYGVEITGEDSGTLHWINTTGEQAIIDDPAFFKKVFCINNNEFNWYQKGSDYSSVNQVPDYSR